MMTDDESDAGAAVYFDGGRPYDGKDMPTLLFPLIAMILAFFASPAMAAEWDQAPADKSWLGPVAAMLLGVFVIAANMKSSKRGHQD